jgi:glycosyltransferase involved in cell wall biosynthesis
MPKVLIIVAHRLQRSPSQRYRFEQYMSFLETQGFEFVVSPLLNEAQDKLFYSKGNFIRKVFILLNTLWLRWKDIRRFKQFDVLFIQREALFFGSSYVERKAFESGKYVIFDFDDSIWLADTSPGNKKFEWVKKPEKFFDNVKYAHTVIAGNAYLAGKTRASEKTVIIPTTIDTDFHKPFPREKNEEYITIGWAGSISTVKHFETLIPVLLKLKAEFGDRLRIILMGQTGYAHPQLAVESVNWSHTEEVSILNRFDIGIMPLPDDAWANGKCGLKALSYMACGVATVASAVGVNKDIIEHGKTGFLANSEDEWLHSLRLLCNDKALRKMIGAAGRLRVQEAYSVEANKAKYLTVFKKSIA